MFHPTAYHVSDTIYRISGTFNNRESRLSDNRKRSTWNLFCTAIAIMSYRTDIRLQICDSLFEQGRKVLFKERFIKLYV